MSSFAIRYPFFVLMACLMIIVVGVAAVASMPVDLFPPINIPVVVVATFYSGMPPEQIETTLRTVTSASSRWAAISTTSSRARCPGVSLIKIYFQPGTDADSAVTNISNLAMANLRRLAAGHAAAGGDEVSTRPACRSVWSR